MSALDLKLAPEDEVTRKILLHAASHSPDEISRMLGGTVSPARVAAHVQTVLKQKDWLTAAQLDMQITWEMREVLRQMRAQFADLDNLKAQIGVLKLLGDRLDKRNAATEHDLNTYHANVGREMARVYDLALAHMRGAILTAIAGLVRESAQSVLVKYIPAESLDQAIAELTAAIIGDTGALPEAWDSAASEALYFAQAEVMKKAIEE